MDLQALLTRLHECEVRFVVIGGVAVGAHGFVRATADLDLVPESTQPNLDRLVDALSGIDATLPTAHGRRFDPERDGTAIKSGRNATLDTPHGGVDIVQRVPGVPAFSVLDAAAVDADVLGVPVRICSLEDLRAMKRSRDNAMDRADLEQLPEG